MQIGRNFLIIHTEYQQNIISWKSGETHALLNLISHQPDIDKMYLFAKDPYEAKNQLIFIKLEVEVIKNKG